jgi:hypothetical protein
MATIGVSGNGSFVRQASSMKKLEGHPVLGSELKGREGAEIRGRLAQMANRRNAGYNDVGVASPKRCVTVPNLGRGKSAEEDLPKGDLETMPHAKRLSYGRHNHSSAYNERQVDGETRYTVNIPYRSYSLKKREMSNDMFKRGLSNTELKDTNEFNPRIDVSSSILVPRDSIVTTSGLPQFEMNSYADTKFTSVQAKTNLSGVTMLNENEILTRIKERLGLSAGASNREFVATFGDLLKEKDKMDKFFLALRSVALEFTAIGYFKEKIPGPKSLWRWLKRFFNDYMRMKTNIIPKSVEESMEDRLVLEKVQAKLKAGKKSEILEKLNETSKSSEFLRKIIEMVRRVLKLAPSDPQEILDALERLESFVSSKGTNPDMFHDLRRSGS